MAPVSFSLSLDNREIREVAGALFDLRKKGLFHAVRETLNDTALLGKHAVTEKIRSVFTLRNQWTVGGVRSTRAFGATIADLQSSVGHLNPYMASQETGFDKTAKGAHGFPIPSPAAAGQGQSPRRTRPIRRPNYLSAITFSKRPIGKTHKQQVAIAIRMAQKKGERYAYLPIQRAPGIYRISGKRRARLTLLYSLRDRHIITKPHKWLEEPAETAAASMPDTFTRRAKAAIAETIRRRNLKAGGA